MRPDAYPLFSFTAPLTHDGNHTWVRLIPADIYISCQNCGILNTDPSAGEVCPGRARMDILNAPVDAEVSPPRPLSQIPGSGVTPW